jgi:hypothetical protein
MQGWEENEDKGRYIGNKAGKSIKSGMSELENDRRIDRCGKLVMRQRGRRSRKLN